MKHFLPLAVTCGSALLFLLAAQAQEVHPPAVLISCGYEQATRLFHDGFALNPAPDLDSGPLTWEQAKQYNVLVLNGLGRANADMTLSADNRQTLATLQRYLEAGGGVLLFPTFGQMSTVKPPQDALLKPLGLTPLFAEAPFDAQHTATATPWKIDFAHTTNIAASPVTTGVTSLWYPTPKNRIGAQNHSFPFIADDSWTVLVRGSATSCTRSGPLQADSPTEPGTYAQNVPLVACKQVGKGRLLYLGITPEYLTSAIGISTLQGVVLDKGINGVTSDGYRLLANALHWLAEPSQTAGGLGGARMAMAMMDNPHKVHFSAPYHWTKDITFPAMNTAYPGVIGARTSYSTGKATPEAWAQAARARGLAYIVFLEDFRHLSRENFDKLKADCARLSSAEFSAVPGFTIDDEVATIISTSAPPSPTRTPASSRRTARILLRGIPA